MLQLPLPPPEALAHSEQLSAVIRQEIAAQDGWISFARYMELALYAPGLGYYSAGTSKFGATGDFETAPEISALFGRTLAHQVIQVLRQTGGDILELGAGSGKLAVQLLSELEILDLLPQRYLILEVSAHLRAVQRETVLRDLPPRLAEKVLWLDTLPGSFNGMMLGNEVLDALPVHIVAWREEGLCERGVVWGEGHFDWQERLLQSGMLQDAASALNLPSGYVSEICLAAPALIASLASILKQGAMLFVDYGFSRREYYHPQRMQGTLMCHYRHLAHADPFAFPGLQDITAHVDFTAVAEAAVEHGMKLAGYTGQGQFLIDCGITGLLAEISPDDVAHYLPLAAQAQKLLSPAEMGELFKAIAFTQGIELPLLGFSRPGRSHRL
jgi:SAM-dependent MidA family methyltransferase